MADWTTLKAAIANVIKANGNQEITGQVLQNTLNNMISAIGENATFVGIATPTTSPGTYDGPVFYIATVKGVYSNFNSAEVDREALILYNTSDGQWNSINAGIAIEYYDSLYNALINFSNSVIYNEYYSVTGNPAKESSSQDRYRRLPIFPCSGKVVIHELSYSYGTMRLYDANKNYIGSAADINLVKGQDVYELPDEAAYIGLYWQKSDDDYSKTFVETGGEHLFSYITKRISDIEQLANDSVIDVEKIKFNTGWLHEYVIYNEYYSVTGNPVKEPSGQDKYRRLPIFAINKNFNAYISGNFLSCRCYNAKKVFIGSADVQENSYVQVLENTEYVGLYWQKSDDNYKNDSIDFGSNILRRISDIEQLANDSVIDVEKIKFNTGWLHEYVIYNEYYSVTGNPVKEPSGQDKYRRLPIFAINKNFNAYISGNFLSCRCYNAKKVFIGSADVQENSYVQVLENTEYVGLYWQKSDDNYKNDSIDFGSNILRRISDIEQLGAQELKTLNIANSDKIAIIGDSYTGSHFTVKNKAYINKLSLFSDFEFVNWSVSGDIYIGRLAAIRNGTNRYGSLSFEQIAPKYAMMCCYANDTKYMGVEDYIKCLDNICTVLKGLGTEPIICTEYHTGNNSESNTCVKTALMNYAIQHNYLFFDIATYADIFRPNSWNSHYSPFWGGSHAGTRTNAIEADPYQMYLEGLERPEKSIKIFRLRNNNYSNLDSLLFRTKEERAKLFAEINVGHTYITDPSLVDNCSSAAQSVQEDEYQRIQSGKSVNVGNTCLVSAIIPILAKNTNKISFSIEASGTIDSVYVMNRIASPYNTYTKYTRFDYTELINAPSAGDTYTCSNDGNEQVFTVVKVVEGIGDTDSIGSIFCTPSDDSTNSGGTLTKVTGNGDATIPYSYRSIGYDTGNITNDTCGHWELLSASNNIYELSALKGIIHGDKIEFLIIGQNIAISGIEIKYAGTGQKLFDRKQVKLLYNRNNENQELLPSNTFASPGNLDENWNVTTSDIYEHINGKDSYPVGCSSIVKVTDATILSCVIDKNKLKPYKNKAYLEIWCRYFPEIYSDGSGNQITETSFDYNELHIKVGNTPSYIADMHVLVNTHWKIVRLPIIIDDNKTDIKLQIYSNVNGIEITYVSLKYE